MGLVPQIKYEKSIHDFERQITFVGDIADKLVQKLEYTNKKLIDSEQLRNNLTEMIVHDIRSPTTSLILYIEALLQDTEENQLPEFYQTSLRESLRAVNLISSISNDLLDIMLIEDQHLVLNQTQIEPFIILLNVYNLFQWVASQAGVQIELQAVDHMPLVLADQDKITRVLYNLVDNALKHVGSNDKITLDAEVREDAVEFIVQDTGRGIPAEFLPRIFEKYAKLETSGRHLGRGLGLTYCRLMVEAHGGTIEVRSTVGEGATFRFTLPRAN
ncbi:sensor histidine kinase [Candidatus Entotheonella palauensis]|uniref:sensor histidine kinase n=1 Tax=Candidatus Entotheonella palauensis TaxID=93172 RepID=UPI000B7DF100|nr:HAMP domain-containing sensor histidine kinase [Candidatus Entotheonella palauensis]